MADQFFTHGCVLRPRRVAVAFIAGKMTCFENIQSPTVDALFGIGVTNKF